MHSPNMKEALKSNFLHAFSECLKKYENNILIQFSVLPLCLWESLGNGIQSVFERVGWSFFREQSLEQLLIQGAVDRVNTHANHHRY